MSNRRVFLALTVLSLVTIIFVLPFQLRPKAAKGLFTRTTSQEPELVNYDIRKDKTASGKLEGFRTGVGRSAVDVADVRDNFVRGEEKLRQSVPSLKIEYNTDIRTPEVIGPEVQLGRRFLTGASQAKRVDILKGFLTGNTELTGASAAQIANLKVAADYTNPDGNLSFVELDQEVDGIPVFRGEVKAGFTKNNEMIRVINNLAPGLENAIISRDFGDPIRAATAAAGYINVDAGKLELWENKKASTDIKIVLGDGEGSISAEKMYFPTEPGIAIPAWRVLIYTPISAYYVIVDADSSSMLWRKNLTEDQTQSATYNVYANPNSMINVADNPFPLTPGPTAPNGTQGAAISRSSLTLIGNEAPFTFNQLGWITDGGNTTDGNNVQAGLDRKLPNIGNPANPSDLDPDGLAIGSPTRVFDYAFTPGNPNTNSGDAPLPGGSPGTCLSQADATLPSNYQKAITTQLFYIVNRYHDQLYLLGFNEAARNFQNTNFTGQGLGNDRVAAQAQDCSGTSNANFTTPADGSRPTMQMYLWPGPTPDFDGSLDADVVIHEHTHGLSNRLHGNASGLSTNMARGMGEGWSDFYGHSLLSEPTDPVQGIYTTGGYATYLATGGFTSNYYYGIRRYPKAVMSFTGPNGKPHNAYTFKYLNSDCNANMTTANFAFARGPFGVSTCDSVHNVGEIWSTALWEARGRFITRLGHTAGNQRMLQLVTDGMKLSPTGPTFLSARDAIIAAAQAGGIAADVNDLWGGFATRGMGFNASIQNAGTGANNTLVADGFDLPNLTQTQNLTVSDSIGDNDGYAEPGENITIAVPITNLTGITATGITATIVGGGTGNYGSITGAQTVSQTITYPVPAGATCGAFFNLTINVNSSLGAVSFVRSIFIGKPSATSATQNFDGVTAPNFPAGWTATQVQGGTNFVTSTSTVDTAPNAAFALDPTTVGGGTDLTSAIVSVTSATAAVTFRHNYNTESTWDGGVLEISIAGGAFQDITAAGGSFTQNGYNSALGGGANNPLAGRSAWSGNSGGYITTIAQLPASANGKLVQLKWRFGADDNTAVTGWFVDTISLTGAGFVTAYSCQVTQTVKSRADFDGDGKTDLSVFRPSDGVWYLNRSTDGLQFTQFGLSGDIPAPGDFDGDGKADLSIYRPSSGLWYRINSQSSTVNIVNFGLNGDLPQVGNYDGDTQDDIALYRPSNGTWWWLNSGNGQLGGLQWGTSGDIAASGDYTGDGRRDVMVFRPSNGVWYGLNPVTQQQFFNFFGSTGDMPAPADYDGDNKDDIAVFRPSDGNWYWINSSDLQVNIIHWGLNGDKPVPGDYNGDGRDDPSVYRSGVWYINYNNSNLDIFSFGLSADIPIPQKYIP